MLYDNVIKAARLNATRSELVNGSMEIMSAADAVLAVFTFSGTAGSVTNDVWTMGFTATLATGTVAAGGGTNATKAQLKNSGGTVRVTGLSVGVATGVPETEPDITLDNVNIAESQEVNIVGAATITHAT